MNEIIFLVEEAAECGFSARALEGGTYTEADTLAVLREATREAVCCHFKEERRPRIICLHFAHDEVLAI